MACTGAEPGATTNLVIDAWDDTTPDVLIGGWTNSGNSNYLTGCRNSDVVPITATSSMSTLQYVRSVVLEGETYKVDRPEFCRHSVAALRVAPFKLYR